MLVNINPLHWRKRRKKDNSPVLVFFYIPTYGRAIHGFREAAATTNSQNFSFEGRRKNLLEVSFSFNTVKQISEREKGKGKGSTCRQNKRRRSSRRENRASLSIPWR